MEILILTCMWRGERFNFTENATVLYIYVWFIYIIIIQILIHV